MPAGNVTAGATYGHEGEAWHRLIPHLADVEGQDFQTARLEAGMAYEVETSQIFDSHMRPIDGWQRLYRSDTGATLSVQADTYAVIGMAEIEQTAEFVLDASVDDLKVAAMLELNGGRQIYVTFRLPYLIEVPGDSSKTIPFFVLGTRHDGRGGMRLGNNSIRPICENTAGAAEAFWDASGMGFTIRHTSNWADKLHDVRQAVRIASNNIEQLSDFYLELVGRELTKKDVNWFLNRWTYTAFSTAQGDQAKKNSKERRELFRSILAGDTVKGIEGTMYGALMAATEICDHHMIGPKTTKDTVLTRQLYSGSATKRHAFMLWAKRAKTASQPAPRAFAKADRAGRKARSLV